MEHLPLPNLTIKGRKVAMCDVDVRRAMATTEYRLLNTPMNVSSGSKHDNINIIMFIIDQPTAALRSAMVVFFDGSANSRFLANDGQTRLIIGSIEVVTERYVGTCAISPKFEYRSTDETVPGSMGSNKT
eukprot:scaffold26667_cov140-Skeletonema_menzelii.AAC.2